MQHIIRKPKLSNILAFAICFFYLWLITPALTMKSSNALSQGINSKYLAYMLLALLPLALGVYYTCVCSAKTIKTSLFIFTLTLCVLEIFLRVVPIQSKGMFYPSRDLEPYVGFADPREPIPTSKQPNEFRIIVLGGSTVFNGATVEQSIPGQINKLFEKANYSNVKVYNFGVVSSILRQQMHWLAENVNKLKPDLVIFYNGGNSIMLPPLYEPRPGYPMDFFVIEAGLRIIRGEASLGEYMALLLMKSKLIRTLPYFDQLILGPRLTQIRERRSDAKLLTPEWYSQLGENFADAVETSYLLGKSKGFQVAVFLQPILDFKTNIHPDEQSLFMPNSKEHSARGFNVVNEHLKTLSAQYPDLIYGDLRDIFANHPEKIYRDFIHIEDEFKIVPARAIFEKVKPKVR